MKNIRWTLRRYGLSYDQVLTVAGFDLDTPESGVQKGNALGELVADAFLWATQKPETIRSMPGTFSASRSSSDSFFFSLVPEWDRQMINSAPSAFSASTHRSALLMANYKPAGDNPNKLDIQRAMSAYGVRDYMLLERSGVTYGIFGLMGEDSHSCAYHIGDILILGQGLIDGSEVIVHQLPLAAGLPVDGDGAQILTSALRWLPGRLPRPWPLTCCLWE